MYESQWGGLAAAFKYCKSHEDLYQYYKSHVVHL